MPLVMLSNWDCFRKLKITGKRRANTKAKVVDIEKGAGGRASDSREIAAAIADPEQFDVTSVMLMRAVSSGKLFIREPNTRETIKKITGKL